MLEGEISNSVDDLLADAYVSALSCENLPFVPGESQWLSVTDGLAIVIDCKIRNCVGLISGYAFSPSQMMVTASTTANVVSGWAINSAPSQIKTAMSETIGIDGLLCAASLLDQARWQIKDWDVFCFLRPFDGVITWKTALQAHIGIMKTANKSSSFFAAPTVDIMNLEGKTHPDSGNENSYWHALGLTEKFGPFYFLPQS